MALVLPLKIANCDRGTAVGKFLGPECDYLASLEGQHLVFKSLTTSHAPHGPSASCRLLAQGEVIKIFRVPVSGDTTGHPNCVDISQPDTLGVYTRSFNTSNSEQLTDRIYFKKFQRSTQNLEDLWDCEIEVPRDFDAEPAAADISVCEISGVNHGTVAVTYPLKGITYFVHPLIESVVQKFKQPGELKEPLSGRLYWVSENVICSTFDLVGLKWNTSFYRVRLDLKSRSRSRPWTIEALQVPQEVRSQRVSCVGPFDSTAKDLILILNFSTGIILKLKNKGVKKVDTFKVKEGTQRSIKAWFRVKFSGDATYYIADSGDALRTSNGGKVTKVLCQLGDPSRIEQLDFNRFMFHSYHTRSPQLVELRHSNIRDLIYAQALNDINDDALYENRKPASHIFDAVRGGTLFSYFPSENGKLKFSKMNKKLPMVRRQAAIGSLSSITGMWHLTQGTLLLTDLHCSYVIEFTGDAVPLGSKISGPDDDAATNWLDLREVTVSAGRGHQLTLNKVWQDEFGAQSSDVDNALFALKSEQHRIIATTCSLHIHSGPFAPFVHELDGTIVDVTCDSKSLHVLTYNALYGADFTSLDVMRRIQSFDDRMATCIITTNKTFVVGFADGYAFVESAPQPWVQLSTGSVIKFGTLGINGEIVYLCTQGFGILNVEKGSTLNLFVRNAVEDDGGYTDFVVLPEVASIAALRSGEVDLLQIEDTKLMVDSFFNVPLENVAESRSFDPETLLFYSSESRSGFIQSLDKDEQALTNALFQMPDPEDTTSFKARQSISSWKSQVFALGDHVLFEVESWGATEEDDGERLNDDEDDCDDDDDFIVNLRLAIYRISDVSKETCDVKELFSTSTSLDGDAFDEVLIKFKSPTLLTIFAHSWQCVSVSVDLDSAGIKLCQVLSSPPYVLDDHWMIDNNSKNLTIIDFHGSVSSASPDNLEFEPCPKATDGADIVKFTDDVDDMVFDVVQTNAGHKDCSSAARFAAALAKPNNAPVTTLVIFDFNAGAQSISKISKLRLPGRPSKHVAVSDSLRQYLRERSERDPNNLLSKIRPECIVGTENGSVYMVASFDDKTLLRSLDRIQKSLLGFQNIILSRGQLDLSHREERHTDDQTLYEITLDGDLLMEAANLSDARGIFVENGVSPELLAQALDMLTR